MFSERPSAGVLQAPPFHFPPFFWNSGIESEAAAWSKMEFSSRKTKRGTKHERAGSSPRSFGCFLVPRTGPQFTVVTGQRYQLPGVGVVTGGGAQMSEAISGASILHSISLSG